MPPMLPATRIASPHLADRPFEQRVVAARNDWRRRDQVRCRMRVVGRLRDPQLDQTLGKQEFAGELAAGMRCVRTNSSISALADPQVVGNFGHRHQVGDLACIH